MRVQYYSTIPPPALPGTEAIIKDIELLMSEFDGNFLNLYPFGFHIPGFPKACIGMQCLAELRKRDRDCDLHHVFLHHLYQIPALRVLKKPVVCSLVTTGYSMPFLQREALPHVIVSNEQDAGFLKSKGFHRFTIIPPGIDTGSISPVFFPYDGGTFTLFCGSAPWTPSQFRKKGFDMLLAILKEMGDTRLVCLWRGVLYEEFLKKIQEAGVGDMVQVINRKIDINTVLPSIHAGIVLAESPVVAAAYPRSLLESLAAGRPVISSACMGIAEYIKRNGCGCVLGSFSPLHLRQCLESVKQNYPDMAKNALQRGRTDFSKERMIESHRELYNSLIFPRRPA